MLQRPIGVLVMAFGSPPSIDTLDAYYTDIRNGERPSQDSLDELHFRYKAIGGISSLYEITHQQACSLQRQLNNDSHSDAFRAFVGFKHAAPSIEDAVNVMAAEGIHEVLAIVMSPFVTDYGPKPYMERAREAAAQAGIFKFIEIAEWGGRPEFIGHWAQVVRDKLSELSKSEQEQTAVIFSAHSLPQDFPVARDYAIRVQASAKHITEAAGLPGFAFAWQSAGKRGRSWLGPDIVSVTRDLWQRAGRRSFIYCPIGFVADHLEVLYDNDIECRDLVIGLGGRYLRVSMPNASESFVSCLADAVGDAWHHSRLQGLEVQP